MKMSRLKPKSVMIWNYDLLLCIASDPYDMKRGERPTNSAYICFYATRQKNAGHKRTKATLNEGYLEDEKKCEMLAFQNNFQSGKKTLHHTDLLPVTFFGQSLDLFGKYNKS